ARDGASGERPVPDVPGANGGLAEAELDPDRLCAGRALHLAGALVLERLDGEPFARIALEARRRGLLTSLDTVWDATGRWERLEPCLPHLDLLFTSLAEGSAASSESEPAAIAAWVPSRGVGEVALPIGEAGWSG